MAEHIVAIFDTAAAADAAARDLEGRAFPHQLSGDTNLPQGK